MHKVFKDGEVLPAADLNSILRQTILPAASASEETTIRSNLSPTTSSPIWVYNSADKTLKLHTAKTGDPAAIIDPRSPVQARHFAGHGVTSVAQAGTTITGWVATSLDTGQSSAANQNTIFMDSTGKLIIPREGEYHLDAALTFNSSSGTNYTGIRLVITNSAGTWNTAAVIDNTVSQLATRKASLTGHFKPGDTIAVHGFHSASGAWSLYTNAQYSQLSITPR
jgi:hypothetical protein